LSSPHVSELTKQAEYRAKSLLVSGLNAEAGCQPFRTARQ
jgi:hypothetical protein